MIIPALLIGLIFAILAYGFIVWLIKDFADTVTNSYANRKDAEMRSRRAHPSNRLYLYEPGHLYDWDQEDS